MVEEDVFNGVCESALSPPIHLECFAKPSVVLQKIVFNNLQAYPKVIGELVQRSGSGEMPQRFYI